MLFVLGLYFPSFLLFWSPYYKILIAVGRVNRKKNNNPVEEREMRRMNALRIAWEHMNSEMYKKDLLSSRKTVINL